MTRELETMESLAKDAKGAFEEYRDAIASGEMDSYDAAHEAYGDGLIYTLDQISVAKEYYFAPEWLADTASGCEELIDLAHEGSPDWGEYTGRIANAVGVAIYENVFRELAQEIDV